MDKGTTADRRELRFGAVVPEPRLTPYETERLASDKCQS